MSKIRNILVSGIFTFTITFGLAACATQPLPEEVCSGGWIGKRANAAMAEFERETRPVMKTLRKSGNALQSGNFNGLRTAQLLTAVTSLIEKMETSQALRDVQTLGETCNDPDLMLNSVSDFMRDQGIPQQVIDMLESARSLFSEQTS